MSVYASMLYVMFPLLGPRGDDDDVCGKIYGNTPSYMRIFSRGESPVTSAMKSDMASK